MLFDPTRSTSPWSSLLMLWKMKELVHVALIFLLLSTLKTLTIAVIMIYDSEIDDLRAMVEYFTGVNRLVAAILGHSKGANIVLEYASKYQDVGAVINVSGRYDPWHIDLRNRTGKDFEERDGKEIKILDSNNNEVWLTIDPKCKVLTVHGNADTDVALEEAFEIGKCIADHRMEIVDGADHTYFSRQDELAAAVVRFAKEEMLPSLAQGEDALPSNLGS